MLEAEQGLIGCVLIDNDALYKVYDRLRPEMFRTEFCQDCYREMLSLYDKGESINLMSLAQRMESNKYDQDTVLTALQPCLLNSATSVVISSYADTIIRDFKSRSVRELFMRLPLMPKDIDSSIAEAMARLEELQTNQEVKSKSIFQIVKENRDNYFKEDVQNERLKTGLDILDDCIWSLDGGDITVVAARPSVGKSALVTQIIGNIANQGKRVGYFNLEMSESQVYERFIARLSKIGLTRIKRAINFLGGEEEQFKTGNDELSKLDIIISTGSKKVSEIRAESRHQNFDVIIIDYLQLIKADRFYTNRASEVGDISKSIKALAMELNVPIILLSQLNRLSEQKDTKEPTMSELRESGDIEQDASNIILIWNLTESRKYKGIKADKNRQGEPKKWGAKFVGDRMEFIESDLPFDQFLADAKKKDGGDGFSAIKDSPFD